MKFSRLISTFILFPSIFAFVPVNNASKSTQLSMVFGPKQALAIEKAKDPKGVESTIQGLMLQKGLSREQAEERYGQYLLNPNDFALKAGEEAWKAEGYKNWEEAAIGRSADPEATAKRIEEFKRKSQLKGIAIMTLGSAALIYYNSVNPYVPPGTGNL